MKIGRFFTILFFDNLYIRIRPKFRVRKSIRGLRVSLSIFLWKHCFMIIYYNKNKNYEQNINSQRIHIKRKSTLKLI